MKKLFGWKGIIAVSICIAAILVAIMIYLYLRGDVQEESGLLVYARMYV